MHSDLLIRNALERQLLIRSCSPGSPREMIVGLEKRLLQCKIWKWIQVSYRGTSSLGTKTPESGKRARQSDCGGEKPGGVQGAWERLLGGWPLCRCAGPAGSSPLLAALGFPSTPSARKEMRSPQYQGEEGAVYPGRKTSLQTARVALQGHLRLLLMGSSMDMSLALQPRLPESSRHSRPRRGPGTPTDPESL